MIPKPSRIVISLSLLISLSLFADDGTTIVLDPGHGGEDYGGQAGRIKESQLVFDWARGIKNSLEGQGFKVILTRDSEKTVSLDQRVKIAQGANANLILSLHAEADRDRDERGFVIYQMPTRESLDELINALSKALAETDPDRKVTLKEVPYKILHLPNSMQLSLGYLSNRDDLAIMGDAAYQKRIADVIANVIKRVPPAPSKPKPNLTEDLAKLEGLVRSIERRKNETDERMATELSQLILATQRVLGEEPPQAKKAEAERQKVLQQYRAAYAEIVRDTHELLRLVMDDADEAKRMELLSKIQTLVNEAQTTFHAEGAKGEDGAALPNQDGEQGVEPDAGDAP